MTTKQPRLCAGIVVTGTCTISVLVGATPYTITIPAGTYWFDPILTGNAASDTIDALGKLTYLIDNVDAGTYTPAHLSATDGEMQSWAVSITRNAATFSIRGANAATNTAGKRFLRFLGYDALKDETAAIAMPSRIAPAIWDPLRGENGSPEDVPDADGVSVRTSTRAFTFDTGEQLLSRVVSFPALKATSVKRRSDSILASAQWANFESTMWPWLYSGSPVRYWLDKNAVQNTYLAAAMTAADTTLTIASTSVFLNDTMLCVDGEWMEVHGGGGGAGTTITVYRDQPVAHGKYAPVSTDLVATYVLGENAGNVNMRGFNPVRRSEAIDRWDMQVALDRTAGV